MPASRSGRGRPRRAVGMDDSAALPFGSGGRREHIPGPAIRHGPVVVTLDRLIESVAPPELARRRTQREARAWRHNLIPKEVRAEPWYRDGLRFACTRCGACCTGAPGYVWVDRRADRPAGRVPGRVGRGVLPGLRPAGRPPLQPDRAAGRRLHLLGPAHRLHGLRGAADPVPHLAVLVREPRDARGLGTDPGPLPRLGPGPALFLDEIRHAAESTLD